MVYLGHILLLCVSVAVTLIFGLILASSLPSGRTKLYYRQRPFRFISIFVMNFAIFCCFGYMSIEIVRRLLW